MTVELSRRTRIAAPRKVALLLSLIVAAIGACVLAGWALDLAVLKSVLPFGVAMKANAAVGILLCGAALAFLSQERVRKPARIGATVAAVAAITLGALTLSQDLAGLDLAIDQWLFRDADGPLKTAIAGRMSPPTSFSMMLMGIALAVAAQPIPARLRHPVLSALGSAVILVGGIALLGRVVETLFEFRFLSYARIASYTALAFVLLGCGLMTLVRSEGGLGWSLDAATSSGFLIGVVAVIGTSGVSYQFTSRLKDDAAQVSYTLEALKEIQKLSAFLGEFTISAGRYIITRDERTLDGREETKAAVQTSLGRLRKLTADRPGQQGHLDHIERLHAQRVAMSNEIITNFRQQILSGKMPSAGEASPLGQQYPTLGREIERLVKAMEADEYALLDRRQKQSDATWTKTFLLLPLGAFVSLTMLSLALFFLNSGAGERLRAQQALLRKGERLSVLHEIDLAIITARTPAQVAEAALPRLRDLLGLPRVIANLFDLEKNEAEWLAAVGRHRSHVGPGIRYSMELMGDLEGLKRGEMQLIDVDALKQRPEAKELLASGVRWYMVVPMTVGGELIGGLSFGGPSREFLSEQTEIAQEVAAQLAIAIAQSRLAERVKRADAQYRLVFENVPVGIAMTGADGTILSANPVMARMLGYASVEEALAALGRHTNSVYFDPKARDEYLRMLRNGRTVRNFEVEMLRKDGTRFWASLDGKLIDDQQDRTSQLVTIIDDITLRREQEHRIARLSRVKEMQSSINSAVARIRERQPLLDELCRIAVEQGGLRAAWVGWHDANANLIRPIASAGHLDEILERIHFATDVPLDAAAGIAVSVLRGGVSRVSNDVRSAAGFRYRQEVLERGILSAMHLPLTIGGATEGVLILYATEAGFFDDEERRLLDELAADVSFALEFLQKSERLDYLAFYDPLTGLPNRSLFHNRLSHSLHSRGGDARLIAVILLDLERFRRVNETLGRKAGDDLLRDAGSRLHRANDTAARVGVDMYGLVLRGARTVAEVNRALEAIVAACFAEPFMIAGEELRVACRAGVSIHPSDGADADTLLRNAEAALRRSKGADDRIVFYAPEMNARVAEALAIENRLRGAIERREFVLHYQPKINLSSGRVTGLEALIRWQDPDTGLVPPGRFIPVLEETGLIGEVGRWAVEQAFVDLRAWAVQGIKVPRVAVNVSAIQLQRRDFVDSMIEEIRRGGGSPEWLELEVTESLVMRNVEDSTRKLSILRGMGVTVAIDDFGTGYSSLSYLGRLPVDSLKIDRSFVSGMTGDGDAAAIVSTIITLAHGLKLKVVAEGVETREQADMLGRLQCDEVQGYLYSRPVPAAEIDTLLRGNGAKFSA